MFKGVIVFLALALAACASPQLETKVDSISANVLALRQQAEKDREQITAPTGCVFQDRPDVAEKTQNARVLLVICKETPSATFAPLLPLQTAKPAAPVPASEKK